MRLITEDEKSKLASILSKSFRFNPNILAIVKNDSKTEKRVAALCDFCVEIAFAKKGAYISNNEKGAALLFENDAPIPLFFRIRQYFFMGQYCVGWNRALTMLRREALIKSTRFANKHLYFWMMAISNDDHIYTIKEMKRDSFALSKKLNLPIVAETTTTQIRDIYSLRYGFELYAHLSFPIKKYTIWFIKREANSVIDA